MGNKRLQYRDIQKLTNISLDEYEERLKYSRIDPESLQYNEGMIIGKNAFGDERVLLKMVKRWQGGKHSSHQWVFAPKDRFEAYLEYIRRDMNIVGSDVWRENHTECIYIF